MKKTALILSSIFLLSVIVVCFASEGNPERGKKLFSDPKLAGSQNETACILCHDKKDTFKSLSKEKNLNETINMCITQALKGNALEDDSQDMKDLKSFIQSQSE